MEELLFPGSHSDVGGLYDDNHAIADVTLDWILEPALKRGLKILVEADRSPLLHSTTTTSDYDYKIHDSLHEPTNGWGLLDPVKRVLDGIRRHPLCDRI